MLSHTIAKSLPLLEWALQKTFVNPYRIHLYLVFSFLKLSLILLNRYSSLGYTEEEKAEVAKQLLSLSHACSQSLEELTSLGVDIEEDINVEEEEDGVNELSTISEEQGEL